MGTRRAKMAIFVDDLLRSDSGSAAPQSQTPASGGLHTGDRPLAMIAGLLVRWTQTTPTARQGGGRKSSPDGLDIGSADTAVGTDGRHAKYIAVAATMRSGISGISTRGTSRMPDQPPQQAPRPQAGNTLERRAVGEVSGIRGTLAAHRLCTCVYRMRILQRGKRWNDSIAGIKWRTHSRGRALGNWLMFLSRRALHRETVCFRVATGGGN